MKFNKHMTNEEVVYKLNYAYTCNQENFHKMLEITKERLDKLTELENIEQELGIDLITLCKALKDGFYSVRKFGKNKSITFNNAKRSDDLVYIMVVDYEMKEIRWSHNYSSDCHNPLRYHSYKFKDYGKTWALTEEELENDK